MISLLNLGKSNGFDQKRISDANSLLPDDVKARIHTLKMRKVSFAGREVMCLFDEQENNLYELDNDGIPTGEFRHITSDAVAAKLKEEPASAKKPAKHISFPFFRGKKGSVSPPQEPDETNPKQKKLLLIGLIGAALVVSIAVLGILSNMGRSSDIPFAENQRVTVIKLNCSVLPGTLLDKKMFVQETISNEKLNELSMTGTTVYTWNYIETLSEMYSSAYIPQETQYLTSSNVSGTQIVYANPFKHLTDTDNAFLEIPANIPYSSLSEVILGRHVDLTVEKKTVSDIPQRLDPKEVEGLDHSSSITERTTTDVFRLKDVVIRDVINADGISLYETLSRYNAVPDGALEDFLNEHLIPRYQESKDVGITDINEIFPEFHAVNIVIELPKEQVKAIGTLSPDMTSLKVFNLTDTYESDTANEIEYVGESTFTTGVINAVLKKLDS